ncbi:zinc ribbon domain-containing protein [Lactobacillus sp. ESL0791]|uniref:zinc ribbon domain-containing protein n=1 Tax=Lactobacillus sp. ESL0791 TaxID=2983234 RepID=UPI0023F896E3|nr:zinc ribbon domain-containing protein [Lactobacillus sp. ESL0791]MDF7638228.1 zinc ribbon domain-containing protein [Lactobacillus sp. ESL0791]
MTTCPHCGQSVKPDQPVCPNCNFNIAKYQETFFVERSTQDDGKKTTETSKITKREEYRQEFQPKKQNSTVRKMITWIRVNATIVFLLGVFLLIVMSFSRAIGWICFLLLLAWLFFVCDRNDEIEQYTVDERLTEKINQVGSNAFNKVEDHGQKVNEKLANNPHFNKNKARTSHHFNYSQLSVVLTSFISLLVLFTGSGASVANLSYTEPMSISKVLLSLAGRMLASGETSVTAFLIYAIWLLLILFPIIIIYNAFKNTKNSKLTAFILSLVETLFLFYIVFRLSSVTRANTGMLRKLTSQLLTYAVSIGTSTYFLILASVMTTGLAAYNLFRKTAEENSDK